MVGILLTVAVVAAGSQQTATPVAALHRLAVAAHSLAVDSVHGGECRAAGRPRLIFRRRAGIVVLHAGVGLMMFGELVVGISAVEGQMQILEGQTVNYVMDTRKIELAFVDASDAREDDVVVIPQSLLLAGRRSIQDPQLPFDVEVVDFQLNSVRQPARPGGRRILATAGMGLAEVAVPVDPVSGTDNSGEANRPAAYVRLLKKGTREALGVYLVGLEDWFAGGSEKVAVDGKTYDVSLRYKHMYKPYSMHLIDVEQDVYMGTQTARSYSSQLRLVDPTRNVDRTVKIWMNNPLRFAGETFYQSNYGQDPAPGSSTRACRW